MTEHEKILPDTPSPQAQLVGADHVDKAEAWDAAQASFQKGYEKGRARIAELEAALKPFADEAQTWPDDRAPDDYRVKIMLSTKCLPSKFTAGDLRRARSALAATTEGQPNG